MNFLLIASILLSSSLAFSHDHEKWKDMPFAEKKEKISKKLAEKLERVQKNKACVDSAQDDAALKACKDAMRAQKDEMKSKWENKKKQKNK